MELSAEKNNDKKRNFAKFYIRAPGDFLDMWLVLSQWDIRKWFARKYLHFTKMKFLLKNSLVSMQKLIDPFGYV